MHSKVWLWVILAVFGLFFLTLAGSYNGLVSSGEVVEEKWAQVENVLQRRYDLIPNLVNSVKGYAKHEKDLLTEVTKLRSQWGAATTPADRVKAANQLEGVLGRLLLVVERYPDLKANQNFLRLQDELAGTENRISVERMRYNEAVREYNLKVKKFPSNMVASTFGFGSKDDAYFRAKEEAKDAPKVEF